MKKHLITVGLLLAAFARWAAGSSTGILTFGAVGLAFESVFWFRLFRGRDPALPANRG